MSAQDGKDEREVVPYETLMAGLTCPGCHSRMTGHATQDDKARPHEDDLTLCWYCGQLMTYAKTPWGWMLQPTLIETLDPKAQTMVHDMLAQVHAAKAKWQGPEDIAQDVPERDGKRD